MWVKVREATIQLQKINCGRSPQKRGLLGEAVFFNRSDADVYFSTFEDDHLGFFLEANDV